MQITFAQHDVPKKGAIIVLVKENNELAESAKQLDEKLEGAISRAIKTSTFKGKRGQTLILRQQLSYELIVVMGIGKPEEMSGWQVTDMGATIYAAVSKYQGAEVSVVVDEITDSALTYASQLAYGVRLKDYRFEKYKTKKKEEGGENHNLKIKFLVRSPKKAEDKFLSLANVADGVFLARDLVNEPPNYLYPESFMEEAKKLKKVGVKITVLDEKQLEKIGFGAVLAVSQGSARKPYVVVMEYKGGSSAQKPVAFVGKGVTFDTGGINLKPTAGMEEMKMDMAGAAAVVGAMHALAARKAKANVIGIIGLVENMPSSTAQRPSDIVTTLSGKKVEQLNTDAEGRLVLCDCIWYVQEKYKVKTVIDLATLTGAILVALGEDIGGYFCNDDTLAEQLYGSGQRSGDRIWRMPLDEVYDKMLESNIADFKTIGARWAGSITAAQYLGRFIKDGVSWSHIDIAGTAWSKKVAGVTPKGGTGFGVRLLDQWVRDTLEG